MKSPKLLVALAVVLCLVLIGAIVALKMTGKLQLAPQPPLARASGEAIETWLADWKAKLPIEAGITEGRESEFIGSSFVTFRNYKPHLEIGNQTSYKLAGGSDLFLVETSKPSGAAADNPLEVAGGYFREKPFEDYAAAMEDRGVALRWGGSWEPVMARVGEVRDPLGVYTWQSGSHHGTSARSSGGWITISTSRSRDRMADTWPDFGSAPSQGKLTIDSSLLLGVMVSQSRQDEAVVITPTMTFRRETQAATFRYLLTFAKAAAKPEKKDEPEWQLKDTQLVPMTAEALLPMATAKNAPMWKRVFAIAWAGQYGGSQAGAPLLSIAAAKGRENDRVRATALASLPAGASAAASSQVMAIVQDKTEPSDVHQAAIRALGSVGDARALSLLLSLAEGKEDGDARLAIRALARSGDKASCEPLIQILENNERQGRHAAAGMALGKLAGNARIPRIEQIARNPKSQAREAAVTALGGIATPEAVAALVRISEDDSANLRKAAFSQLSEVDRPEALAALRKGLADPKDDVRESALGAISALDNPARVAALTDALNSPNNDVQQKAIQHLSSMHATGAAPAIAQFLKNPAAEVSLRREAARAVGRLGYKQGLPQLLEALRHKEKDVRVAVIEALGDLKDPSALDQIGPLLKDTEWEVRREAADTLGMIESARSAALLAPALQDSNDYVRRTAASSFAKLKYPQSVEVLMAAVEDKDSIVRNHSAEGLEKLTGQKLGKDRAAWQKWWQANKAGFGK
jgi:HEAT repeat protein